MFVQVNTLHIKINRKQKYEFKALSQLCKIRNLGNYFDIQPALETTAVCNMKEILF